MLGSDAFKNLYFFGGVPVPHRIWAHQWGIIAKVGGPLLVVKHVMCKNRVSVRGWSLWIVKVLTQISTSQVRVLLLGHMLSDSIAVCFMGMNFHQIPNPHGPLAHIRHILLHKSASKLSLEPVHRR